MERRLVHPVPAFGTAPVTRVVKRWVPGGRDSRMVGMQVRGWSTLVLGHARTSTGSPTPDRQRMALTPQGNRAVTEQGPHSTMSGVQALPSPSSAGMAKPPSAASMGRSVVTVYSRRWAGKFGTTVTSTSTPGRGEKRRQQRPASSRKSSKPCCVRQRSVPASHTARQQSKVPASSDSPRGTEKPNRLEYTSFSYFAPQCPMSLAQRCPVGKSCTWLSSRAASIRAGGMARRGSSAGTASSAAQKGCPSCRARQANAFSAQ